MKALLTVLALGCVFGIFFCISLLEKLFGGATLHGLYARMLCRLRRYNDWRTTLFVPLLRLGRKLAFLEEHWNFRTVLLGPVFPDPISFQVTMPQKREPLAIVSSEKSFLQKTQETLKNLGSRWFNPAPEKAPVEEKSPVAELPVEKKEEPVVAVLPEQVPVQETVEMPVSQAVIASPEVSLPVIEEETVAEANASLLPSLEEKSAEMAIEIELPPLVVENKMETVELPVEAKAPVAETVEVVVAPVVPAVEVVLPPVLMAEEVVAVKVEPVLPVMQKAAPAPRLPLEIPSLWPRETMAPVVEVEPRLFQEEETALLTQAMREGRFEDPEGLMSLLGTRMKEAVADRLLNQSGAEELKQLAGELKSRTTRELFLSVLEERFRLRLKIRDLTPALLELIRSDDDVSALRAGELLKSCQDWRAGDRLVYVARTSSVERIVRRAVQVLEGLVGDQAVEMLASGLERDEVEVRRATCRALGCMSLEGAAVRLKKAALEDADTSVRITAALSLVSIEDPKAEKMVMSLLDAQDRDARYVAAQEVGRRQLPSAIAPLSERVLAENDAVVSEAVVDALCRIGSPAAMKALLPALENAGAVDAVVEGIRRTRMAAGAAPLADLLDQAGLDETLRLKIMETLAVLDHPKAMKGIFSAIRHGSREARLRGIEILGERDYAGALGLLSRMLETNPSLSIRIAAAKALSLMKDDRAQKMLENGLLNGDPEVRRFIAHLAGQKRSDGFLPILARELQTESHPEARHEILDALGRYPAATALETLCGALAGVPVDLDDQDKNDIGLLLASLLVKAPEGWASLFHLLRARDLHWQNAGLMQLRSRFTPRLAGPLLPFLPEYTPETLLYLLGGALEEAHQKTALEVLSRFEPETLVETLATVRANGDTVALQLLERILLALPDDQADEIADRAVELREEKAAAIAEALKAETAPVADVQEPVAKSETPEVKEEEGTNEEAEKEEVSASEESSNAEDESEVEEEEDEAADEGDAHEMANAGPKKKSDTGQDCLEITF